MSLSPGAGGPLAAGPAQAPDWDASTYDRVSTVQQGWAAELIERLAPHLRGDEVLLDAGCGSGSVTAMLAQLVPRGRIYAVDVAPSMVAHTKALLRERVCALRQDLTELSLLEPVDAVFSNAAFHWIADHQRLFTALAAAMKPGALLVAQCGGAGNIEDFRVLADEVATGGEFAPYFAGWKGPWNYADAEVTAQRLAAAGFVEVQTWTQPRPVTLAEPESFVSTVCLVRHLDMLPNDLRPRFVRAVLERAGTPLALNYVRLNMTARRAGAVGAPR